MSVGARAALVFSLAAGCSDALGPNDPTQAAQVAPALATADAEALVALVEGEADRISPAIQSGSIRGDIQVRLAAISKALAANSRAEIEAELSAFYTVAGVTGAPGVADPDHAAELGALTLVVDRVRAALEAQQ